MSKENEEVLEDAVVDNNEVDGGENKPKLNNAVMLFAVVTLGVAIWFGTSMVSNPGCNEKVVKTMKDIKVPTKDAKVSSDKVKVNKVAETAK